MNKSKAATSQPPPVERRRSTVVFPYVLQDILHRVNFGKEKYGTFLKTKNGRDCLWDAYQEALDLCIYLRQEILERDNK